LQPVAEAGLKQFDSSVFHFPHLCAFPAGRNPPLRAGCAQKGFTLPW